MFDFLFGTPVKKLDKVHAKLVERAMHAQRNGDMALFVRQLVKITWRVVAI
jgi:hypothetical protein